MLGWQSVAGLDWARLYHAYGPAADTPAHLQALTGRDLDAQLSAIDHLSFSIVHQFSIHPATSFAVRVVGGVLDDPALRRRPDATSPPLLADLIDFLDEVAYATGGDRAETTPRSELSWDEVDVTREDIEAYFDALESGGLQSFDSSSIGRLWEWSLADLHSALSELVDVISPFAEDSDAAVRIRSICLLTRLGCLPSLAHRAQEVRTYLWVRMQDAHDRDQRAALVVGIGELGGDTSPWLEDSDEAIRTCAAAYARTVPAATTVLVDALTEPEAVNHWFGEPPWRFHSVRGRLLHELVEREIEFEEILPAALAIAPVAIPWLPDEDWGLLLQRAFPGVEFEAGIQPPPPASLDRSQRAYLEALLANESLWDPKNGTARLARMRAGIPQERAGVAELLQHLP